MTRRYDASRRRQGAARTRQRILEAALKLHWEGITAYEALARQAGCSLATVRKHFPTKEVLFHDCTRTFAESLTLPDLAVLARIADPARRLETCVAELCRIHEAMFGYAWLSAQLRDESPTLEQEMRAYEGLADGVVEILASGAPRRFGIVRGLLDFLTYRALRRSGGLSAAEARDELIAILRPLVLSNSPIDDSPMKKEKAAP
jgi:AcrR family transcriptional regulator